MQTATLENASTTTLIGRTTEPIDVQSRFGIRLRNLRLARGWTQAEAAGALGMDRGHICELERGRKTISLSTMEMFALGFDMDLSELLEGV